MTARVFLAWPLAALCAWSASAQCVSGFSFSGTSTSIGLRSSSSAMTSGISTAASGWSNCEGIPDILANQAAPSGGINVTVNFIPGPSTRTDGACAQGAPTLNANNGVTGGTITVWDSFGPNAPPETRGFDCRPYFGGIIAHELGHVLGLKNSVGSCPSYIMGSGVWNGLTGPNATECGFADGKWALPEEEPPPPQDEINHNGSPIVLPLGRPVYELTSLEGGVQFDLLADGRRRQVAWTAAGSMNAFLALDRNGNGEIDDGGELFGDHTPLLSAQQASNGFDVLAELDANQDGVLDAGDPAWFALLLWTDRDHDGRAGGDNELEPLAESRVLALGLDYRLVGRRDEEGNLFPYMALFRMRQGHAQIQRNYYDVFLRIEP